MDLGSVAVRQEVTSAGTCGSAPTSPKTMAGALAITSSGSPMQAVQTHPLNLASGLQRPSHHNVELLRSASSGSINSRSLPNIPSAMGRPGAGGLGSKVRQHTVSAEIKRRRSIYFWDFKGGASFEFCPILPWKSVILGKRLAFL